MLRSLGGPRAPRTLRAQAAAAPANPNPLAQIPTSLIPMGQSQWSIGRDNVPFGIGSATITRNQNSINITTPQGPTTIAFDPNHPGKATLTVNGRQYQGTITRQGNNYVFNSPGNGTLTLSPQGNRLYMQVNGFGAGNVSGYYLYR